MPIPNLVLPNVPDLSSTYSQLAISTSQKIGPGMGTGWQACNGRVVSCSGERLLLRCVVCFLSFGRKSRLDVTGLLA